MRFCAILLPIRSSAPWNPLWSSERLENGVRRWITKKHRLYYTTHFLSALFHCVVTRAVRSWDLFLCGVLKSNVYVNNSSNNTGVKGGDEKGVISDIPSVGRLWSSHRKFQWLHVSMPRLLRWTNVRCYFSHLNRKSYRIKSQWKLIFKKNVCIILRF